MTHVIAGLAMLYLACMIAAITTASTSVRLWPRADLILARSALLIGTPLAILVLIWLVLW